MDVYQKESFTKVKLFFLYDDDVCVSHLSLFVTDPNDRISQLYFLYQN